MKKIQVQGVHHITIVGSTRQSAIDFWQGALGMPFIFEQPNLGKPDENHLYFDPGDGRLLTVFTNESREDARRPAPREVGCVEHLAFNVSRATFTQAPLVCANVASSSSSAIAGSWTRSTCRIRTASKSNSPATSSRPRKASRRGCAHEGAALRVERGDHHITEEHLADAIEPLLAANAP